MIKQVSVRIELAHEVGQMRAGYRDDSWMSDVGCVSGLLEDAFLHHRQTAIEVFDATCAEEAIEYWLANGVKAAKLLAAVQELRKVCFDGDIGETLLEIRNYELSEEQPGAVTVLCSVLEFFAQAAGPGGRVWVQERS